MPTTTRSSTAPTRGLGDLGRLPYEIRCLIYKYLLLADLNIIDNEPKFYKRFREDHGVYHKDEWVKTDSSGREVMRDLLPSRRMVIIPPSKLSPGAYEFEEEIRTKRFQLHTNILCVSKFVNEEASEVICAENLFVHIQWTPRCLAHFTGHRSFVGESPLPSVPLSSRALSAINKDLIAMKIDFRGGRSRAERTLILCPASELYRLTAQMSAIALTGDWDLDGYSELRMSLTLYDTCYLSPLIVSERLLNPFNHIFKADQTNMYQVNLSRRASTYKCARDEAFLVHETAQSIAEQ